MEMQKSVIFAKKNLKIFMWKIKNIKDRDHCQYKGEYRGASHSICNSKCSGPKKIPIAFHKRSNNDYHFIIKMLTEEFKK